MRDLNRLLRGNGLYIKQAPTQLGLNSSSPAKIWDFGNLLIQRCNEISGWDNISYEVSSDIDT